MYILEHPELFLTDVYLSLVWWEGCCWPWCQREVKKKCSTCLSWCDTAHTTTSRWLKNKPSVKRHNRISAPAIYLCFVEVL